MSNYKRVIPRDFFNEAKLLKCLGLLALKIHENKDPITGKLNQVLEDEGKGFEICQHSDGSIGCVNYFLFDNNGTPIYLSSGLNSRLNFPLIYENHDYSETFFVFDEEGEFTKDFINLINGGGDE